MPENSFNQLYMGSCYAYNSFYGTIYAFSAYYKGEQVDWKLQDHMKDFFRRHKRFVQGAVVLIAGVAIGYGIAVLVFKKTSDQEESSIQELRQGGYQFVDPLLVANPVSESTPFENKLKQGLFDSLNNSNVYTTSVYFQELNSGQWAGINTSDTYNPASLLKVPYMIAYLKEAETDPAILSEKLLYQTEPADGTSTEFDTLVPDRAYTVEELLQAMIEDSDNGAKYTLLQHIDPNVVLKTFNDLGISEPNVPDYTMSIKPYARFFKILYNATYLNADMSELAMEFLNQATFKDGIVGGVPADVSVAHKFGQYAASGEGADATSSWELSDCGVVYYPNDPYLLCVMAKGAALNSLEQVIQEVSRIAYGEVDSQQ